MTSLSAMPRNTPRRGGVLQPARVGGRVEHREELFGAGMVAQQLAPVEVGVLAGGVRHLVDEALLEETILAVVHAAPETDRHMRSTASR